MYSEELPKQPKVPVKSEQTPSPSSFSSKNHPTSSVTEGVTTVKKSFKDLLQTQQSEEPKKHTDAASLQTSPESTENASSNEIIQSNAPVEVSKEATAEDVVRVWPVCISEFSKELHLFAILSESAPKFENNEIVLQLISDTQASIFKQEIESRLCELIRFHLKDTSIRFKIEIRALTEEESKKKPVTPQERYAHLLNLNEKIQKLRDSFNLEIE